MGYTYIYEKRKELYAYIPFMWMYLCERERERPFELFKFKTIVLCAGTVAWVSGLRREKKKRAESFVDPKKKKIVHALSCYWYDSNNLTSVGRSADGVHRETTRCVNHKFRIAFSRRVFQCCYRVDVREMGKRGKRRLSRDVEKKRIKIP